MYIFEIVSSKGREKGAGKTNRDKRTIQLETSHPSHPSLDSSYRKPSLLLCLLSTIAGLSSPDLHVIACSRHV